MEDGSVLTTIGDADTRTGVQLLDDKHQKVAENTDCPGVHGEGTAAQGRAVFGREDVALVFADGGVTALGLNITNMALLGTAAGYLLIAALLRILPRTLTGLAVTSFVASVVSVVVAALGFVVQYALGGTTDVSLGGVAAAMVGMFARMPWPARGALIRATLGT